MTRVSHDYHRGGALAYLAACDVHRAKIYGRCEAKQFPNAVMVDTPVHASWHNQVEVHFSIVQRKALSPSDFTDLAEIEQCLTRFEVRYSTAAKPFKWKFTTNDLADLLERLDRHQETQAPSRAQPAAA